MRLAERLREVLALDPSAMALEFEAHPFSWGELGALADAIGKALVAAGAKEADVIGWAAQNSPAAVAALVAMMLTEHCAAIINPHLGASVLHEELVKERFPVIVGDPHFWALPGLADAAKSAGSAGLVITWDSKTAKVEPYPGLEKVGPGKHRDPMPDYVIERVSSGTTGPPKRSPHGMAATMDALRVGERKEVGAKEEPLKLKTSPMLVYRSLAHAGSFSVMLSLYSGRPIVLEEKFSTQSTIDAIRRHKPKVLQLVPTMIKMIMDADVPPEVFKGVIAARSGTAPLDPKLQEEFEEKYGVPILIDYGATEFGGVCAWTLADHKQFAKTKRGSVGRPVPGAQIRVLDQETGEVITDGRVGLLDVQVAHKTKGWVSTNDLVTIDSDSFLYIHGRADDAIIRGGFKVLPDEIVNILRRHPGVQDAAVVGVPDERLGAVPVAVIETRPGQVPPDAAELKAFARAHLTPYQVPVAFKFTDKLPRTASMKVIRPDVLQIAMN